MMKIKHYLLVCLVLLFVSVGIFAQPNPKWITVISMTPSKAYTGDNITFNATFRVAREAASNLRVIAGVDGSTLLTKTYQNLAKSEDVIVQFSWKASSTTGDRVAFMKIDPDNTLQEYIETDNDIKLEFYVNEKKHGGIFGSHLTAIKHKFGAVAQIVDLCVLNKDAPTDLYVISFNLSIRQNMPQYIDYTIVWKNYGKRCIKDLRWKMIDHTGAEVTWKLYVTASNSTNWPIKGDEIVVEKGALQRYNLKTFDCINKPGKCSKFKVFLDDTKLVPETNETNNGSQWVEIVWP